MNTLRLVLLTLLLGTTVRAAETPAIAPAFTHPQAGNWINSAPLDWQKLRGKVVLLEFWTFDCINCLRSTAWVKHTATSRAKDGLVVIGVHTPELPQERDLGNVRAAVQRLGIDWPVLFDGDYSYWNAMNNHYWPAFYLVDASGHVRATTVGELHVGEARALRFEKSLDALLAEAR